MTAVADIFDRDGDGYIDYYEFVAALHPNKDAYRPTTDADKIEDEVKHPKKGCSVGFGGGSGCGLAVGERKIRFKGDFGGAEPN